MAEFRLGDMANFSISHDLFSDIPHCNERFSTLPEEERANLRGKFEKPKLFKSTKIWLNVFNEWKVQRNEARYPSVVMS